jgi:ferric iron reductase protein FhuF
LGAQLDVKGHSPSHRDRLIDTLVPAGNGGHGLRLAPDEPDWQPMTEFLGGEGLDRALELTGRNRRIEQDPVAAASWFVLSYVRLVVSPVVTGWYLVNRVPEVAVANMAIRPDPDGGGSHELGVFDGTCTVLSNDPCADRPDARTVADQAALTADMVSTLISGHVTPLVEAIDARVRIGSRLLWGNVSHRVVNRFHDLVEAGGSLEKACQGIDALCDAPDSPLRGLSRLDEYNSDGTHTLATRLTCCLRYKHPGQSKCSTCSLLPLADRIELAKAADAVKRELAQLSSEGRLELTRQMGMEP